MFTLAGIVQNTLRANYFRLIVTTYQNNLKLKEYVERKNTAALPRSIVLAVVHITER